MQRKAEVSATVSALMGLLLLLLSPGCDGGGEEATPSSTAAASPTAEAGDLTATPLNGASIVVDSTADSDARDGALTLREAMGLATGELTAAGLDPAEADNISGTPGPESADSITFDPSLFPADATATISLTSTLPALGTDGDSVDGSGSGAIIDGGSQGVDCFQVDSDGNAIRGLQIQNCRTAIVLGGTAENNTIGGSAEDDRNVIGPNDGVGVGIHGDGNVVQGNYIGTDVGGTESRSNRMEGIWIAPGAENNVIGGSNPGEGNLIAGNNLFGINIDGVGARGNVVKGNYIGVDASGRFPLKNRYGLVLGGSAQNNVIGGKEPGEANVISGNQSAGVMIRGSGTSGNVLKGNFIGPDSSGSKELRQGTGIWMLEGAQGNVIGGTEEGEGNIIAHSGTVGVLIDGADTTGNTIRGNSILSDGRNAIVTKNGGNLGLAQPTIGSAGPLKGTACAGCTVDVYSGSEESQVYEGSATADATGAFTFDGALSGSLVTATATDAGGNTSPYSEPFAAPAN
jgi:titin